MPFYMVTLKFGVFFFLHESMSYSSFIHFYLDNRGLGVPTGVIVLGCTPITYVSNLLLVIKKQRCLSIMLRVLGAYGPSIKVQTQENILFSCVEIVLRSSLKSC